MATTEDAGELRLMTKASSLYYLQDLNQREIASRLHLSRPKVSRLLRRARDRDIVQISVMSPEENFVDLETEFETHFGLEEVLITSSGLSGGNDNSDFLKQQIGAAAANYLRRTVKDGDVLGVTWGTTLQAMMRALQPTDTENVHVVQTLGGVGPPEAEAHAADLSRRLAQLLDGKLTALPTPGIVDSPQARDILMSDRHAQTALELFPDLTTAYVGIGALSTNPIFDEDPAVPDETYNELVRSEAVGDIALRFFDEDGRPVHMALDNQLIGITLEQLHDTDCVVGVAGGLEKIDAIHGALRGQHIDVLITDYTTAAGIAERF
ncbi:MAG: sugar-binding transcriptional regulator [Salinivenus sp.]